MVETSTVVLFANVEKLLKYAEQDFTDLFNSFNTQVEKIVLDHPLDALKLKHHLHLLQKVENTTLRLQHLLKSITLTIEQSKSNVLHELCIDLITPKKMSKKLKKSADKMELPESQSGSNDLLLQAMQTSELI